MSLRNGGRARARRPFPVAAVLAAGLTWSVTGGCGMEGSRGGSEAEEAARDTAERQTVRAVGEQGAGRAAGPRHTGDTTGRRDTAPATGDPVTAEATPRPAPADESGRKPTASDSVYRTGWYARIHDIDELSELAREGSTLVLPYHTDAALGDFHSVTMDGYLDEAAEHGLEVIVEISKRHRGQRRDQEDPPPNLEGIRRFVEESKDHPAVHGWYLADEPNYDWEPTPSEVAAMYEAIKSVDREHPVYVVHYGQPVEEYAPGYDVLMIDWYPRDTKGGKEDVGEFNWMVRHSKNLWERADRFADRHGKEGWAAVLSGHSGQKERANRKQGVRTLTMPEYRYYLFTALAHGARAVLYWMHYDRWTDQEVRRRVSELQRLTTQIGPYLRAGTTYPPNIKVTADEDELLYRHGALGNRHVLLAINIVGHDVGRNRRAPDPAGVGSPLEGVRFELPEGWSPDSVTVVGEGRTLAVRGGAFTDDFARFGVHIYAFTAPDP